MSNSLFFLESGWIKKLCSLAFDLVNGIQTDEALDDWKLTVVLYIGTYLGANHISIWRHGITDTTTKEKC